MFQEKRFDTGQVSLNYAEGPVSGPPLVLIHGLPGRWQEFEPVMGELSSRWHLYAFDMRGQGLSGHVVGKYLPDDYTADLVSILVDLVRSPAVVFGMSAGGLVALKVAAQQPEDVRGLIIGDSPVDLEALAAWMNSAPFAAHFKAVTQLISQQMQVNHLTDALGDMPVRLSGMAEPPRYRDIQDQEYLLDWAETLHSMDPDVLRYHAAGRGDDFLDGLDVDTALKQIECPTLLLRGDPKLGALLSAEASAHACSLLQKGKSVFVRNSGHSLGLSENDPAPLMAEVQSFLSQFPNS